MKFVLSLVALLVGQAAAFSSPPVSARTSALADCLTKEQVLAEPDCTELGKRVWDPLGLADLGSDETLAWFRHAEVKHGRVCMAAFVGWWATGAGLRWPGEIDYSGLKYSDIPSKGLEAWAAVPAAGKAQILMFIGFLEWGDEYFAGKAGEHYLKGGVPGKVRHCVV